MLCFSACQNHSCEIVKIITSFIVAHVQCIKTVCGFFLYSLVFFLVWGLVSPHPSYSFFPPLSLFSAFLFSPPFPFSPPFLSFPCFLSLLAFFLSPFELMKPLSLVILSQLGQSWALLCRDCQVFRKYVVVWGFGYMSKRDKI